MPKLEGEFTFNTNSSDSGDPIGSDFPEGIPNNPDPTPDTASPDQPPETLAETPLSVPPTATSSESLVPNVAMSNEITIGDRLRFYTSLAQRPKGVTFDAQDLDEEIILLIRRSFVTNLPWILVVILLGFLPGILALFGILNIFSVDSLTLTFALLFFYLILFGAVIVNFALWYFHVGIVTNKRVIDVDLHGLLSRHVAEARLVLVQDVSHQQIGFFRSLFNYGDVFLQTAGSSQNIEFDRIPRPVFVSQAIGELVNQSSE